ncbi:MAG: cation transporter [Dehalococcoidia bacterium]|nr:MAG: cation transporter [Dehalococcoidia bacterium]
MFIVILEIVGGLISNSLALQGDAGHMFIDALALSLALFAIKIANKPATATRTYGYHRAEILAALTNGVILILVSLYIFYEAYQRILEPPEVQISLMLPVAIIGLVANIVMIVILRRSSQRNLNIKAALWHIIGDTVSSLGIITGGIIISFTKWYIVDSMIAIFVGLVILYGAVKLVRESTDILLESVPPNIQIDKVVEKIKDVPGVEEVHDVHIWTITSGVNAMSAHLIIEDQKVSESGEIVDLVNRYLAEKYNITHTTLQLECEKCESCPSGVICNINRPDSK